MAKRRSCRRTAEEDRQHEIAVKIRKMTDEQIVNLIEKGETEKQPKREIKTYTEEEVRKKESEAFCRGHQIGKSEMMERVEDTKKKYNALRNQLAGVSRTSQKMTRAQIRALPKTQREKIMREKETLTLQQKNRMKMEIAPDVEEKSYIVHLTVMMEVLKRFYWKKSFGKKFPEFYKQCVDMRSNITKKALNENLNMIEEEMGKGKQE